MIQNDHSMISSINHSIEGYFPLIIWDKLSTFSRIRYFLVDEAPAWMSVNKHPLALFLSNKFMKNITLR